MRRRAALFVFALAACEGERATPTMELPAPAQIKRALSLVTDLTAAATLVPRGSTALDAVELTRAGDGVSFSGFIRADPGDYTLELVFSGVHASSPARLFLGRWTSDAFTVVRGETASPVFSRPLDVIGRDGDHGDDDGDQLGVLDELLWNVDPADPDSDGDNVTDGSDCTPADANDTFVITAGGSIEDCDGDGARRPDLPITTPGDDCDDRDANISPRKDDVCGDGIDADCNAATCGGDTGSGPRIVLLDPAASSTVGCHRRIAARITDSAGVTSAQALFLDDSTPPMTRDTIGMQPQSSNVYATGTLDIATPIYLVEGPQKVLLRATNSRGATSELPFSITFQLGVPQVTISPPVIGEQTTPFSVTVSASAPSGIASIALMRAPVMSGGSVDRSGEVELGRAMARNSAMFTIDPLGLAAGDYAIYPVVADNIGNQLRPERNFSLETTTTELEPDYLCLFDAGGTVPVRDLVIPGAPRPGFERVKMRAHLDEAIAAAAARDPNAVLVEIRGDGIEPDGTIALDRRDASGKWWLYTFFNFTDERRVEVRWYSANSDVTNPVVEVTEMDPFGFSFHAFASQPSSLADSDVAVAAYAASPGCPAITGLDSDFIRYLSDEPFTSADVVRVDVGDIAWKGTATEPVTALWMCM